MFGYDLVIGVVMGFFIWVKCGDGFIGLCVWGIFQIEIGYGQGVWGFIWVVVYELMCLFFVELFD